MMMSSGVPVPFSKRYGTLARGTRLAWHGCMRTHGCVVTGLRPQASGLTGFNTLATPVCSAQTVAAMMEALVCQSR